MKYLQKGYIIQIVIAAVAVALVGGIWYGINRSRNNVSEEANVSNEPSDQDFSGSVFDLADRGGDYRCTLSSSVGGSGTEGLVYISQGKVKGEFDTTIPQFGKITSFMIANKDSVYTWSSLTDQGFILPRSKEAGNGEKSPLSGGQNFDYDGKYEYNCEAWSVDESIFTPPANINFSAI